MQLDGKYALVTGAAGGVGRAVVRRLVSEGCNVWACARGHNDEFLEWTRCAASECRGDIYPLFFDLRDSEGMKEAVKEVRRSRHSLDIVVNNAGTIGQVASFGMTSIEKVAETFEINLFSQMRLTQLLLRLISKGASIVNISSFVAEGNVAGQYGYGCSKAAMIAWTKMLARELAGKARVNAIAPGVIETGMLDALDRDYINEMNEAVLMHRAATPEEIADGVLFLASGMSTYITGIILPIQGGGFLRKWEK